MNRIKTLPLLLLIAALALAVVACTGQKSMQSRTAEAPAPRAAEEALQINKEQVWQLVSLRGKAVGKGNGEVILMFHPESGTLRGRIACNRYFADYSIRLLKALPEGSHYALRVSDISGGDVQCPEGGMALQERYLALLGKATECLLTPYTLVLMQKDKELMKFELQ